MAFDNLKTSKDIEKQGDTLGGFTVFDSDVYPWIISLAYVTMSKAEAMALNLVLVNNQKQELRQTIYLTSNKEKGKKNYYEKDGIKHYLPGFNIGNAIAMLTTGKEIGQLDTEDKVINLWNYDSKKEIPTTVPVFVDMLQKPITLAIIKQVVSKRVKGADNRYYPTAETREENEINAVFRSKDNLTISEIEAKATEPTFVGKWLDKWKGKIRDKRDKNAPAAGAGGAPGEAVTPSAPTGEPTKPLFP